MDTTVQDTKLKSIDTPMMRQYNKIKEEAEGKLLFFRMGDFYELFGEDAVTAAPILGIALTARDKKNSIPMCGIPYHAVNNYISKLTDKGYSVAICEQLEDPKDAKGIVKRGLTKIVTPSLSYDPESIDKQENQYLIAVYEKNNIWSYSAVEYSTGKFFANSVSSETELIERLRVLGVKEIVYPRDLKISSSIQNFLQNISFTVLDLEKKAIKKESLFGIISDSQLQEGELLAAKTILYYLKITQFRDSFPHITYLAKDIQKDRLLIDEFSIKNLELLSELLPQINYTKTAMGSRFLRQNLLEPLYNINKINLRQKNIEKILGSSEILESLKNNLQNIPDLERLTTKVLSSFYSAQTVQNLFYGLKYAIETILEYKEILNISNKTFNNLEKKDLNFNELYLFIENKLNFFTDTPPVSLNNYGTFTKGYNEELDALIDLTEEVSAILKGIEQREREQTGIQNLRIKFNKVFGYYIEISKGNASKAPEGYIRKQTLVNAERFITEELKELETKILDAQEQRLRLEQELLADLVIKFSLFAKDSFYISKLIAEIDLIFSFAKLAFEKNYIKPTIHTERELVLKGARHPILEHYLKDNFIPNDISFNENSAWFHIVTGPNMSGKSTLMRSVSIIVILAHMGSFVPAIDAKIPLTDQIFTRVGATDYISRGQSTFMVEMVEAANILRSASDKSFIIIDEIGRGTSTFDGISIAWSVAEYINNKIKAKCMFATHYHELTVLEDILNGVKNYSMAVEEDNKNLIFTRKYIASPSQKSYGINVAKMAGLPKSVITQAMGILKQFESEGRVLVNLDSKRQASLFDFSQDEVKELAPHNKIEKTKTQKHENLSKTINEKIEANNILDEEIPENLKIKHSIFKELEGIDPNDLTPMEALSLLYKWKEKK